MNHSSLLAQLTKEMGYGGFIHSFKNYVVRRDSRLLTRSINSIQEVSGILKQLDNSLVDPDDRKYLSNISSTVNEYQAHLQWMVDNSHSTQTLPTRALDQKVKVDDTQALIALQSVIEKNRAIFQHVRKQTANLQASYKRQLIIWASILSLIYWTIVIACYIYYRSFIRNHNYMSMINDLSPSALVLTDGTGKILEVNTAFCTMFGISSGLNVKGSSVDSFVPDSLRHKHKKLREDFQASERTVAMNERTGDILAKRLDGTTFPVQVAISSRMTHGAKISLAVIKDLSGENKLREEARLDHLTKAYNRRHSEEVLKKELYRMNRYGEPLTIMLVDIDNFKRVNDTLGHQAGDRVILNIVNIIESHLRESDVLCRWGGDEFLCILPSTQAKNSEKVAHKLVTTVRSYYASHRIKTTLSIGIAEMNKDMPLVDFISNADKALYDAKSKGRDGLSVYQKKSESEKIIN